MVGLLIMLVFILVCVILWAVKASNDEDELLKNKNTAAPSTSNGTQTTEGETQTADNAPNDGSTPTTAQPATQGAPLTREELDRLLFKYHDKLFGTIVKAILMALFLWSAIGGIIAGFIVAASVR